MSEEPEYIFVSEPDLTGQELGYVKEAFEQNWIGPLGPHIDKFEEEICEYVDVGHAVAVNSGTSALHLALLTEGIGEGDEVFVSSFSFAATVNPILYQGAEPVFIGSESESWNLDPDLVEKGLARYSEQGMLPDAVVVTHVYGQSAQMERLVEICSQYDVPIIEDAAEALGTTHRRQMAGTFGKCGVYSFNGNKMITTSTGGMLVSDDADLIATALKYARQSKDDVPYYRHSDVGYNYRMSNILAGIGRAQLESVEDYISKRKANFEYYRRKLADIPGLRFMPDAGWGRHTRWMTAVLIDEARFGCGAADLRQFMSRKNIEGRRLWTPLHEQPYLQEYSVIGGEVGEDLFRRGLCLPSSSGLTDKQRDRVVDAVTDCHCRCT